VEEGGHAGVFVVGGEAAVEEGYRAGALGAEEA
jgi:hypothetical protein